MAMIAITGVVVLLCVANVHGFNSPSAPAVNGIYHGRFGVDGINVAVQAVFSQGGVIGTVAFSQVKPGGPTQIHVNLMGLDQYTDNYRWSVSEFPVRASLLRGFPCTESNIGGVYNPTDVSGPCNNTQEAMCAVGDLTSRFGALRPDQPWQTFEDPSLPLTGPDSIVGRALVIDRQNGAMGNFICANIEQLGARLEILRAGFDNQFIQGDVIFRYAVGRDDVTVEADLYRATDTVSGVVRWTVNSGIAGPDNTCLDVGIVFGSAAYSEDLFNCGRNTQKGCPIGDLTRKCDPLEFIVDRARVCCTDCQLGAVPRTYLFNEQNPSAALVVVIRDENSTILGCSQLEMIPPVSARTQLRYSSVFGDFLFWQTGPDDRTYVRVYLTGLNGRDFSLRIYTNPVQMGDTCDEQTLGAIFSKPGGEFILPRAPNAPLTSDAGSIGALDVLLPLPPGQISVRNTTSSSFLPLFGPYSIVGKTLALVLEDTNRIVACNPIMRQGGYPQGELASLLAYQDLNNPPLPSAV